MHVFYYNFCQRMQKNEEKTIKNEYDLLAKILVIGDGGVGKTALVYRFTEDRFPMSYTATIGVDFKSKIMKHNEKNIKMQIWDTAGQERFKNITQAYYRGSAGILLTFSLTDKVSFQNIQKWTAQIEENASKDCAKLLVATKLDCESDRVISRADAEALAMKIGINYIQTSAKQNQNVDDAFQLLVKQVYQSSIRNIAIKHESMKINSKIINDKKRCAC